MIERKELNELINDIVNGKQDRFKKKFNVYSTETSSGKTAALIKGCAEIHKQNKNKIVLVVTKLIEEQLRITKEINELAGEQVAIALISDRNKKNKESYEITDYTQIINYKIVVVTHSLYCLVSKSRGISDIKKHDYIFNYYMNNNIDSVLIIDEELNPVKNSFAALSIEDLNNLKMLFNGLYIDISEEERSSQHIYYCFCSWVDSICGLLSEDMNINYDPVNMIHRVKEIELQNDIPMLKDNQEAYNDYMYESLIDNFNINKYGKEISNYIERYSLSNPRGIKYTFEGVKDLLKIIHQSWNCLINGICLIDPKLRTIYSYDYDFNYMMLGNNIILDASACFTKIYQSELFNVVPTERIISHAQCKLYLTKYNTTTSSKKRNAYKYKCNIVDYIERTISTDEKALVITSEADCQLLKKNLKRYDLNYRNFDNMRGLNNYRDYNKMYLVHTPRQLTPYYIFCYEWYFKKTMADLEMETKIIKNEIFNSWGFVNCEECQKIMITDMASSIYQGIKRIERNTEPKATWHIWIKDVNILLLVIQQLNEFGKDNIVLVEDSNNTYNKNVVVEVPESYLGIPLSDDMKKDIAEYIGLTRKGIKVTYEVLENNIKNSGYILKMKDKKRYIYTQEIIDNIKLKEVEVIEEKEREKEMKKKELINYLDSIVGKVLVGEEIEELKAMFDYYGTKTRSLSFKALTGFCEDEGLPYIITNNEGKRVTRQGKKQASWKVSKIIG